MSLTRLIAAALAVTLLFTSARPAAAEEPLADRVRASINNGMNYLKKRQENRGGEWNWENSDLSLAWPGGSTCLATLALLTCGEKPNSQPIQKTLPYIRGLKPANTYVVALQSMVLAEVGEAKDLDLVQRNVDWLLSGRLYADKKLTGWSYGKGGHLQADNSNTQYALLGLLAGRQAGVKIAQKDWEEIQNFYISSQVPKNGNTGGWPYRPDGPGVPSHTMTTAGLSGLFISGLELNQGKQGLDEKTGIAKNCGKYDENDAVARGMRWLAAHFDFDMSREMHRATFYNVYGVERVGRLSGQRFLGEHDWYREGCELLCGVRKSPLNQNDDGSWRIGSGLDNMPVISTSFALLFLSKGRTPILVSKLAYDSKGGDEKGVTNWNRKHHDARHLADYASRALFKKQPLAWQVFDARNANLDADSSFKEELASLLQSPILYMNGHTAPNLPPRQVELLRRYVEEGGFIFAEACCGDDAFIDGFERLMDQVFKKESKLVPMRPDHPIWSAHMPLDPKEFIEGRDEKHQIQCIERGCKTVVVFSPQPLAGYWEEVRYMPTNNLPPTTRGELAYRFAGNVIAYATGLEMPKPRLTKVEIADAKSDVNVSRRVLKLAQVRHDGDWQPAPQAMRNLAAYLNEHYKLDVSLNKEEVKPGSLSLLQYKFMYMHGRREFTVEDEEVKNLRNNLRTGATLFADACCGAKEFDKAFRALAHKLYPDKKLERIPLDDFLYGEKLNGKAITSVKCRRDKPDGGGAATEYEEVPPELEGVKIGNRWVIIYSKYDIGCALEKSKSSACKGHDPESARVLAAAAMLYSLRR
jgi:hypothetical protein